MNAAHVHLALVHLPVIGSIFAAGMLIAALRRGDRGLTGAALALIVVSALGAIAAYYTGPPAQEALGELLDDEAQILVGHHAAIAKLALVLAILSAIIAVQGFLQLSSGEQTSKWVRWGLVATFLAFVYVAAWTAHLGARIQHEELRGTDGLFFPPIERGD